MSKLPKGYLSWSQINLVLTNPKQYVRQYIDGDSFTGNVYTDFGSYIHDNIEQGRRPHKLPELPLYSKGEVKTYTTLRRGDDELVLFGFFDGLNDGGETHYEDVIGEYKTGGQLWSYNKAQKHGQLKLYSLMHQYNSGAIPRCELVTVETEFSDEGKTKLRLTGRMRIHKVQYTANELHDFEQEVIWPAYDKVLELVELHGV